jgi:hypothetical protein
MINKTPSAQSKFTTDSEHTLVQGEDVAAPSSPILFQDDIQSPNNNNNKILSGSIDLSDATTATAGEDESDHTPVPEKSEKVELPKEVAFRTKRQVLLHLCLFHLAPSLATFGLFGLYAANYQFKADSKQINALLFAAKAHEALIVISLSDILFHRIRFCLLTNRGVPFGLLASPFQTSDPLFLFKPPFLASLRHMFASASELVTTALVIVTFLLAALAAPSVGIALLPKLDWWPVPETSSDFLAFREQNPHNLFLPTLIDNLFPGSLDVRYFNSGRLNDLGRFPARFNNILAGVDQIMATSTSLPRYMSNITLMDGATVDSISFGMRDEVSRSAGRFSRNLEFSCTAPLISITETLLADSYLWMMNSSTPVTIKSSARDSAGREGLWKQPRVSLQCAYSKAYDPFASNAVGDFHFPEGLFGPLDLVLPSTAWNASSTQKYNGTTQLLNLEDRVATGISTAVISYDYSDQPDKTLLCLLDSQWRESSVWVSTPYTTILQDGVSVDPFAASQASATSNENRLTISPYMGQYPDGAVVSGQAPFDLIRTHCRHSGAVPKCQMAGFAMYLVDSLRRIHSTFDRLSSEQNDIPPGHTKVEMRFFHQVYAYSLSGSVLWSALAVLFLHVLLVWVHVMVVALGDRWYSRIWSELGELVALSLGSTPPALLQNTGAGVGTWATWRHLAFIKQVGDAKKLELVFLDSANLEWSAQEYEVPSGLRGRYT